MSRSVRSRIPILACVWFLILVPAVARGQQFKANLTGTVTDSQGALVPGVTVTVVNTDTNVSAESVTDTSGVYSVKDLTPGPYKLTASLQGFKTFVRGGLILHTAETATVAVKLDVGALEETVTVTAGLSEVETNQSVLSQTMDNKKVSELPLNGRQVYMLLQLTSGSCSRSRRLAPAAFPARARGTSTAASPSTGAAPATTNS